MSEIPCAVRVRRRAPRVLAGQPARERALVGWLEGSDAVGLLVAFAAARWLTAPGGNALALTLSLEGLAHALGVMVCWQLAFAALRLHDPRRALLERGELTRAAGATGLATLLMALWSLAFPAALAPTSFLAAFCCIGTALVGGLRIGARSTLAVLGRSPRSERRIAIAGTGPLARDFAREIESQPHLGARVIGFIDENLPKADGDEDPLPHPVCLLKEFSETVRESAVDEVVIALPLELLARHHDELVGVCDEQGITVRFLSGVFDERRGNAATDGDVALTVHAGASEGWALAAKRGIDLLLASAAFALLSPVMLLAALAIKLDSRGPVLFVQQRVGLNKRIIRVYKLRTMVQDAARHLDELLEDNESGGPTFKLSDDPRITRVGRFLRKTSIDELPQLWNVITGDMSLVGPRPLPLRDVEGFTRDTDRRRFSMRPGITCLWQVSGRCNIPFEQWMELDRLYIDHWSLRLDLQILLKTIPSVLHGEGAR